MQNTPETKVVPEMWEQRVFRDREKHGYVMFDVDVDGETVAFRDAFTGEEAETVEFEAFLEKTRDGDFFRLSYKVMENLSDAAEAAIYRFTKTVDGETKQSEERLTESAAQFMIQLHLSDFSGEPYFQQVLRDE